MPRTRRRLLATLGIGFASGCLRTTDQSQTETTSNNERTTSLEETGTPTPDGSTEESTVDSPVSLSREWTTFFNPAGRPFVADGILYTGSDNGVRAINTADGTERWRTDQERINMLGTLAGDRLYYSSLLEEGLYSVGIDTGTIEAERNFGPAGGAPTVVDDTVITGTDQNSGGDASNDLAGFATTDFAERWTVSATNIAYTGSVAAGGQAIVGFGSDSESRIESRSPTTGTVTWSVGGYLSAPLTVHDGYIYAPVAGGGGVELHKIDPSDGTVQWRHLLTQEANSMYVYTAAPTFADGRLYLASYTQIHAVDIATGQSVWETRTDQPIEASPAILDGYIWVTPTTQGGSDGRNLELLGFDTETGDLAVQTRYASETANVFSSNGQLLLLLDNQATALSIEPDQ